MDTPMPAFELTGSGYTALIHPAAGGMVGALRWQGPDGRVHPILRPEGERPPSTQSPNQFGTWAMLPFANRAFGSVVDDGTQSFTVPANGSGGTIHGFGWQAPWQVLEQTIGHTVLEHTRSEGPDPYRYRARQEIRLGRDGMTIGMTVTNLAETALPFGFGHHPWFCSATDTTLQMRAEAALVLGETFRATGHQSLAAGGPYAQQTVFATGRETAWSFLGMGGCRPDRDALDRPGHHPDGQRQLALPCRLGARRRGFPLCRAAKPRHRLPQRTSRPRDLAAHKAATGRGAGRVDPDCGECAGSVRGRAVYRFSLRLLHREQPSK